jgi:hypothetical protein
VSHFTEVENVCINYTDSFCSGNYRAVLGEYQHWYPDRRQLSRCVLQQHTAVRAKSSAFMPPAHIGHGRLNVQNEEEAFDAVYANPSVRIIELCMKNPSESSLAYTA